MKLKQRPNFTDEEFQLGMSNETEPGMIAAGIPRRSVERAIRFRHGLTVADAQHLIALELGETDEPFGCIQPVSDDDEA